MTKDFRPSQIQLEYLNKDMLTHLENLGCDMYRNEYFIKSIDWYNWDDNPRWFVHIGIFDVIDMKERGYVEVDMYCDAYNGPENCMSIERVEFANHGYPCISTTIARLDKQTDDYTIYDN